jgi:BNR repeat-like domain
MFALAAALAIIQFTPATDGTPNREPQLAASAKLVALAYGSGNAIYVATSADRGRTFSKPAKVAEAGVLPLSRHRGPRIAIVNGAIVVTAVTGRTEAAGSHAHGLPSDGDLFAWRSTDGGRTWSAAVRVNDVPAAAREGLHALASDGHGKLFAAWLDLRKPGTRLYGALSTNGGATWSANTLLYESPDGSICQCCHPSVAIDASARIWVMFRNSAGGARDMYITSSADGGTFSKAAKLGTGSWKINACPMDGGGIALERGRLVTAWRREKELYLDVPGEPEQRIGEGADIAIAAGAKGVYAAWTHGGSVMVRTPRNPQPITTAEHGAFPTLLALPGGNVLAAWEDNGKITVQPLP